MKGSRQRGQRRRWPRLARLFSGNREWQWGHSTITSAGITLLPIKGEDLAAQVVAFRKLVENEHALLFKQTKRAPLVQQHRLIADLNNLYGGMTGFLASTALLRRPRDGRFCINANYTRAKGEAQAVEEVDEVEEVWEAEEEEEEEVVDGEEEEQ